ncbi:putative phosphoesterase [Kalymmatonema gypsitolerans NIES-4073]|nr:putative phosphoesterase [Scytonema sp. NIES-4073]
MSSDLIVEFGPIEGLTLFPDDQGTVTVTVTNQGDQQVNGPITLDLFASTDPFLNRVPLNVIDDELGRVTNDERLEGTDELLGRVTNFAFNLAPGESTTLTLDFATEELRNPSVVSPGAYYLIGQIDSNNIVVENDETNNVTRLDTPSVPPPAFVSTEGTDVVLDWNSTFLNAVQFVATRPITSPPFVARNAAIVHTAIYDAVTNKPEGVSVEAAAVGAAYQTLTSLFSPAELLLEDISAQQLPELSIETEINAQAQIGQFSGEQPPELSEQTDTNLFGRAQFSEEELLRRRLEVVRGEFDRQLTRSLDEITDDPAAEQAGFNFGVEVANRILQERQNDGALEAALTDGVFTPGRGLGEWRPTPPDFVPALLPDWGNVATFGDRSVEQIRSDLEQQGQLLGPAPFGSEQYLNDLNEVLSKGERNSTARTDEETEIALFWAYDRPDTFRPPGQWNEIAQEVALQEGRTLVDNARLFADLNRAMANAGILAWDVKYDFQQLRPITAIRQTTDLDWTPLLDTPPFPDYISGHSVFGGAAAGILSYEFGNNVSFNIPSQELPGEYRSFSSFTQAAMENADSRVYGGVHVRSSVEPVPTGPFALLAEVPVDQGLEAGFAVANLLLGNTISPM